MGLKYYDDIKDKTLSDLFIQANIKTDNQLMDSLILVWQDCTYTGRSTGACMIFYQGGPIDHITHVPGPVSQSSKESKYN